MAGRLVWYRIRKDGEQSWREIPSPSDVWSLKRLRAARRRKTNPEPLELTLLAEDAAGSVVAVGTATDGGLMHAADGSWRLSLHVADGWRHRGVGTALLEALEAHARANAASRVVVAVRATDPEGAAFA